MEIKEISAEEALHYCTKEEDHFFDRKAFGVGAEGVQKIAVAFANADGGEFVVGVIDEKEEAEPKNRWRPAPTIEKLNPIIQALNTTEPTVDFSCAFLRQQGVAGYVLWVGIEKGKHVHETAQKKVIVRAGAQSQELKGNLRITELAYAKGLRSFEDELVKDSVLEDIESSPYLLEYTDQLKGPKVEPIEFLIKQNLIHREDWTPKVSSILLFAENPSALLPKQCAIRCVRYNTSDDSPERDDLTEDNETIEAPIYAAINLTYEKIVELCNKIEVWTMTGLQPISYPKETIWELLVNAIIHRDYAISDNIFVGIFNDRIEIRSPGKLPGLVKVDNILDNRFSRNSKLVRMLARYPSSPNRDLGEGINTAFQKMKAAGKTTPSITEDGNFVKVIINNALSGAPEEIIIAFASKFGSINNRQARDLTGIRNASKISSIFSKLRESNELVKNDSISSINTTWSRP